MKTNNIINENLKTMEFYLLYYLYWIFIKLNSLQLVFFFGEELFLIVIENQQRSI